MDQNNLSQLVGFAARSPLRHVKLALPTDDTAISRNISCHGLPGLGLLCALQTQLSWSQI